jgi:hypothetical protein
MLDWDRDEHGRIALCSVLEYETAILAESCAVLRLRFARSEEQKESGGEWLPLVLSPQHARQIARSLLQMADQVEQAPPAGTPRN